MAFVEHAADFADNSAKGKLHTILLPGIGDVNKSFITEAGVVWVHVSFLPGVLGAHPVMVVHIVVKETMLHFVEPTIIVLSGPSDMPLNISSTMMSH